MTSASAPQTSHQQRDPDAPGGIVATAAMVRIGAWLFERRTWLPLPLAIALLLIPARRDISPPPFLLGAAVVALGECIRLWGVHHIGAISRTRSDRLGPLVSTGPFALVRNPLYLGNIALWVGFALSLRLLWIVPIIIAILGFEYHAIVRWEETLLESRRGEEYRAYITRVPRWLPKSRRGQFAPTSSTPGVAFSWRETFFSERGTLIAIAAGFLLIYLKLTV
jgi:protein-S-isoprenylcysteine O-methyltransferase Ste14